MTRDENRNARRDKKAARKRYGMRVSGGSVKLSAYLRRIVKP